jgi:hypothetical protein
VSKCPTPLQAAQASLRWLKAKQRIVLADLAKVERAALLASLPGARLHARSGQVSAAHPARQRLQPHSYGGLDGRTAVGLRRSQAALATVRKPTAEEIAQANAYLASLGVPERLL